MAASLKLNRRQILAFRRQVAGLAERLPRGRRSLQRAAWAGLQDSMPRAALLSIHARVAATRSTILDDPSLIQVWGPRFSVYAVAERDLPVFTLGRLPEGGARLKRAQEIATRLWDVLGDERMKQSEAASAMGAKDPNELRYAAPTGTIAIHWDGARQPTLWRLPVPDMDPYDAHLELARRYLHVFGPATADGFNQWAGLRPRGRGAATFEALVKSLTPVRTPIGDAWILSSDEPALRAATGAEAPTRLLPSGDTYYLLQGAERELLIPDERRRNALWTSRVWPGALLVEGEIVGIWRRSQDTLTIEPWQKLSATARKAVEAEAQSLPLPGIDQIGVRWR